MEKPLNVLLVEDDGDECKEFIRHLEDIEDIRLIGVTGNEKEALELIKDRLPDAVILDLELHKGSGNGISFLETLGIMEINTLPYILVTTHNISRITHERVRQLGVDFIMVKCQGDYSAENVVDFLRSHKKLIHKLRKKMRDGNESIEASPFEKQNRLEARVAVEVDRIGISPRVLGRTYLIEAILHRIGGQLNHVAEIAKKYKKNTSSIERAMQNAIDRAWYTAHPEDLLQYYTARVRSDKGVPTVTEFIHHYANKIKIEYRSDVLSTLITKTNEN